MTELTAVKNDVKTFISEKSSFYSISEEKLMGVILQFLSEQEAKPTLYQVDIDDLPENVKKDLETPDNEIEYVNL